MTRIDKTIIIIPITMTPKMEEEEQALDLSYPLITEVNVTVVIPRIK
jgi:hypothetical protein